MRKNRQKTERNPQMKHGFFTNLPPEITMEILSRLSIESILSCKCVCKSWFNLVEAPEFAELHLSRSLPGLVIFQGAGRPKPYKILEFADEFSPQKYAGYCNVLLRFTFPHRAYIHSSVNGLLFMHDQDILRPQKLFICNPITRDYLTLPRPCGDSDLSHYTFGFGVSKMTAQYKLVMIYQLCVELFRTNCGVYTLGTTSWRSIEMSIPLMYDGRIAAFLNGNLHWLAVDSTGYPTISCFDLETEDFSTFGSPPNRPHNPDFHCFSVLGDCLCICDSFGDDIVVWLMKDYGYDKSWTKEFVMSKPNNRLFGCHFPIKVFKDGEILIAEDESPGFLCYSNKTRTVQAIDPFNTSSRTSTAFYTPSFLSVKMFVMEYVRKF